jgi:rod shape-determining protein MreD
MRPYLAMMATALAAAVLQSTVLQPLTRYLPLDLLLVMAVIVGLSRDPLSGAAMCAVLGYIEDVLTGSLPGLHMTSWLGMFFLAQALRVRLSPDSPLSQFLLAALLCAFEFGLTFLLVRMFSEPMELSSRQLAVAGLGVLAEAALTPIFFFFLSRFERGERGRGPRPR